MMRLQGIDSLFFAFVIVVHKLCARFFHLNILPMLLYLWLNPSRLYVILYGASFVKY